MALLEAKGIRRSFGGLVAVNEVSFQVLPGQIKAVIGSNGAGKTTLFNIISGLLKADAGEVLFKERSLTGCKPYQIARVGISRTFQNPSLFLQMTVLENVMVGRHRCSAWEFAGCCLRLPGRNWITSDWRTSPSFLPARWPLANAAWWNWPVRWPQNRSSCSWTNRPAD